jgi:tetratricopeptide (TPR) repeat protein
MKKRILYFSIIGALAITAACDLLDPTEVVNPNLKRDQYLQFPNPMTGWVRGLERQLAIVLNAQVINAEIASDNYDNTGTYFNQNLDPLNLIFTDTDIYDLQFRIADLRESVNFGLTEVKAADTTTTTEQEAELYFYKGYAELLAGELFVALPAEPNGPAVSPEANLNLAIGDFKKALDLTQLPNSRASYNLALARAYHRLGDKANARAYAEAAIASNPDYVRFVRFDNQQGLTNDMELGVFDRITFDDLQPLPRLDFLDPKYHAAGPADQPVAIQKIEEAHLILAEVALADNNLPEARTYLTQVVNLANGRPRETFSDLAEGRTQAAPDSRPNQADIQVAASASDPPLAGLVLARKVPTVTVPTVSGTSVTASQIDLLVSEDAALETLYLMRQEIFLAEGRRMTDLGIRFPVSEVESLANRSITPAHTTGYAPPFVKDKPLDAFSFIPATKTVVIEVNMNKVLVEHKTSADVLPFH